MEHEIAIEFPDFSGKGEPICSMLPDEEKDMFVADKSDEDFRLKTNGAKALCNSGCPYLNECFSWAMEHGEAGVWGGTSEQERRAIKRSGMKVSLPLTNVRIRTR